VTGVRIGVMFPFVPAALSSPAFVRDVGVALEDSGAESVWTAEHVVFASDYEPAYPYSADGRMAREPSAITMPDPLEMLAFLAACTERLILGTCVVVAPLHSAAVLAKRAATIACLSSGRLRLGLGIGWQREEYAAVGVSFTQRGARLEECIGAMRALWRDDPATFEGEHVGFRKVHAGVRPPNGSVPIILGGNSTAAVTRAGRMADGWFPFTLTPDDFTAGTERLRRAASDAGRHAHEVEITAWPGSCDPTRDLDPSWIRQYLDAGATRLVIATNVTGADDLYRIPKRVEAFRAVVEGAGA
jgi:probable F420-dependent oxidoreductase